MKKIFDNNQELLGYIFNIADISETKFVTSNDQEMQLGFHSYPEGKSLDGHVHLTLERSIKHTSEFIQIVSGVMQANIYCERGNYCSTYDLRAGDCLLQLKGGHSFLMKKDVKMFELKQGPYMGNLKDKVTL